MRWIIGIVVVVVIAILGYQYFGARDMDVAEQTEEAAPEADQAADATEETAEEAAGAAEEAAEQAATEAEQATEEAAEATEQAADQAQETAEQAATGAEQATEEAAQATEQAADQAAAETEQAAEATEESTGEVAGAVEDATGAVSEEVTEQAEQVTDEAAEQTQTGAGQVEEALTEAQIAALTVGDVNVGEELTTLVQNAQDSLEGITDAQSAEAAVPTLNDINAQLEELSGTVDQLPEDAKKVLADVLGDRVAELKTAADNVTNQEGVGEVVNPALEPIMAKLDSWAQQPA